MNHKSPDLNIRYATGVGDLVACILHSKPLEWLVKLITKQNELCYSCSQRRIALNILFPIKFWKFFFKTDDLYLENLKDFYIKCGFNATIDYENKMLSASKFEEIPEIPENLEEHKNEKIINDIQPLNKTAKDDFLFLNSNEITLGDYVIRTEYYKKI